MPPESKRPDDRRCKVTWLDRSDALCLLNLVDLSRDQGQLLVTTLDGLPEDAWIGALSYDFSRDAIGFRIHSMEFDPTPDGLRLPVVGNGIAMWKQEVVHVRTGDEQARIDKLRDALRSIYDYEHTDGPTKDLIHSVCPEWEDE